MDQNLDNISFADAVRAIQASLNHGVKIVIGEDDFDVVLIMNGQEYAFDLSAYTTKDEAEQMEAFLHSALWLASMRMVDA